jgi:hypothetical protein
MSEDPLGFAAGDVNLYRYVGNSYPNATDPSGTTTFGLSTAIGTVVGFGIGFVAAGLTGEDGWDWQRAWAGGLSGAAVGAGVGLLIDTWGGSAAFSGALIGFGVGSALGGLQPGQRGVDLAGYGLGGLEGGMWGLTIGSGVGLVTGTVGAGGRAAAFGAARTALRQGATRAAAREAGRAAVRQGAWRAGGQLALAQAPKGVVGGGHAYASGRARGLEGADLWWSVAQGTAGGLADPTHSTYYSAVGSAVGYAVGAHVGGERGALLGMDLGSMTGGLAGSARYGWVNRQGTSHGRWYTAAKAVAPDVLGGGVGAGVGYAATGTLEGALYGAQLGQTAVSLAAVASPAVRAAILKACFAAGTPLLTAEGSKPIEEIRVGDRVLSRPEGDVEAPVKAMLVEEVFVRTGRLWVVRVGGRDILTTAEHPFFVRGKGWVPAGELQEGDLFSTHEGRWVAAEGVYDTGEYGTVYNLRVAEYHTYFVGCDEWGFSVWAHNASCGPNGNLKQEQVTPKDYGLETIAENPRLLDLWAETLHSVSSSSRKGGPNKFQKFWEKLQGGELEFTNKEVDAAFRNLSEKMTRTLEAERIIMPGEPIEIHHWNYPKKTFPLEMADPRNLTIIRSTKSEPYNLLHDRVHRDTSVSSRIVVGPTAEQHLIQYGDTPPSVEFLMQLIARGELLGQTR